MRILLMLMVLMLQINVISFLLQLFIFWLEISLGELKSACYKEANGRPARSSKRSTCLEERNEALALALALSLSA